MANDHPQDQAYYKSGFKLSVLDTHNWRKVANAVPFVLPYLKKDQSLLDVGCGPGLILIDFANYVNKVTGIEPTQELIDVANKNLEATNDDDVKSRVKFQLGLAYEIPFPDDTFDVVFALQVVIHLLDPVKGLAEMARVCKPGGYVLVIDADMETTVVYPEQYRPDIMAYFNFKNTNLTSQTQAGRALKLHGIKAGYKEANLDVTALIWCISEADKRRHWADMYIARIKTSGEVDYEGEKEKWDKTIKAWDNWAQDPNSVFIVIHGQIVYHKP